MINTIKLEEAKKLIKKEPKPIIIKAQDTEFNRKILEYGRFQVLLSPDDNQGRQTLRFLDSGFDYVMAKAAAKNGISIGIDLSNILKLDKTAKALRLSKIKQNLEIAKKANTKIKAINYKDKRLAFSLLLSLGASTKQASQAIA